MKRLLRNIIAISLLSLLSTVAFAQGTVNFNTVVLGTNAQVYDRNGTLASGSAFKAQLYAAPGTAAEGALVPVGNPVGFRASANAGYVQTTGTAFGWAVNPVVTISTAAAGGPITVQLRAWDAAYPTYAAALTAGAQGGASPPLTLAATGNPNASPPGPPVNLTGLKGFRMGVANQAPVVADIPDQQIYLGETLRIAVLATDPDQPPQILFFSLGPNSPAGASINANTGMLTWTPSSGQAPSTNTVTVIVADGGTPPLSATKTFKVVVSLRYPVIARSEAAAGPFPPVSGHGVLIDVYNGVGGGQDSRARRSGGSGAQWPDVESVY